MQQNRNESDENGTEALDHNQKFHSNQNGNESRQNGSESLHGVSYEEDLDGSSTGDEGVGSGDDVVDVEDIGDMMFKMKKASADSKRQNEKKKREMVTPEIRQSLTKQG